MDVDFKAIGLIFWKHLIIHSSKQWPEDKPRPIQSPVPEFGSSATPAYVYVVVYSALDFLGWPIPPQPWNLKHCIPSDVPRRVWLRTILSGHSPRPCPSCYVWCFVFCQFWKGGLNLRPRQRSPCSFMHAATSGQVNHTGFPNRPHTFGRRFHGRAGRPANGSWSTSIIGTVVVEQLRRICCMNNVFGNGAGATERCSSWSCSSNLGYSCCFSVNFLLC